MRNLVLLILLLLLPACSDKPEKDAPKPAPTDAKPQASHDKLGPAQIGDMKVQKFGGIYLGGQPSDDDLKQFDAAGVKTVINLRPAAENPKSDEAKFCESIGIDHYYNPAFDSPDSLSDPIFTRVRDLLTNKNNQPLLLHCASGNRVGAVWLAHRVLDDGVPYEKALEEAKAIGMKPQYEARVKQYIDSKPEDRE